MKIFESFFEILGWLRIAASPLLIGLVIGIIIYVYEPTVTGIVIGSIITIIGLIVGIVFASRIWKKHGTMNYISKLNETPDLDKILNDIEK